MAYVTSIPKTCPSNWITSEGFLQLSMVRWKCKNTTERCTRFVHKSAYLTQSFLFLTIAARLKRRQQDIIINVMISSPRHLNNCLEASSEECIYLERMFTKVDDFKKSANSHSLKIYFSGDLQFLYT